MEDHNAHVKTALEHMLEEVDVFELAKMIKRRLGGTSRQILAKEITKDD